MEDYSKEKANRGKNIYYFARNMTDCENTAIRIKVASH